MKVKFSQTVSLKEHTTTHFTCVVVEKITFENLIYFLIAFTVFL